MAIPARAKEFASSLTFTRREIRQAPVEAASPAYDPLAPLQPVDPLFAEFYAYLGGETRLGPAISPLFETDQLKTQYVEAGLMVYDPRAVETERYRLAPLALQFDVAEPGIPEDAAAGGRYVNGHLIYPEFALLYEQLGGARFVGRPLTEARHNPARQRIEQYFENLGFYRLDQDPPGTVRLLAYGAFACDRNCRYQAPTASIPRLGRLLPEPFAGKAARLGLDFTGRTLGEPQPGPDGRLETVFENLVLVEDPQSPEGIAARPIVELLGFQPGLPSERREDALMVFYPVRGELGYHVPVFFHEYIQAHGGAEFFGAPLGEVFPLEEGVFRQCFASMCLDFDLNAPAEERLVPAPLGPAYWERYYDRSFQEIQSLDDVRLQVWESRSFISSGESAEIHVAVYEGQAPLSNREPVLTLTMPDGSLVELHFPPTGENGQAVVVVPAMPAPNGTLIAYQVCLSGVGGEQRCVGENYLIWN